MKILITGGSGFIGRNVKEYLSARYSVLAPAHSELELLDEKAVENFLAKNSVDIVIHSAVKPGHRNAKDLSGQLYTNTRMFFNLARNNDRYGKMIFIGSGAVYDMRAYRPKMKEEYFDTSIPADEHGFSKYIIAKYIERTDNILELRVFGIFGKYEDYAIRFISNAICKTLHDLPITIKQNRKFDYINIDDLVKVVEHFMHNEGRHKAYNVTPDASIDLLTLAEKVRSQSGNKVPILVRETGAGLEYSGDNSRLRAEMPELKLTSLDESIARLYDWYAAHLHVIERDKLLVDR